MFSRLVASVPGEDVPRCTTTLPTIKRCPLVNQAIKEYMFNLYKDFLYNNWKTDIDNNHYYKIEKIIESCLY